MTEMALSWQNLLQTVCFGQNGFILAKDTQNSGFAHNGFILAKDAQKSGFGHSGFFWQKMLKTVVLTKMAFFR